MAEKEDRMQDLGNTQYFKVETEPETGVKLVLSTCLLYTSDAADE